MKPQDDIVARVAATRREREAREADEREEAAREAARLMRQVARATRPRALTVKESVKAYDEASKVIDEQDEAKAILRRVDARKRRAKKAPRRPEQIEARGLAKAAAEQEHTALRPLPGPVTDDRCPGCGSMWWPCRCDR